MTARGLRVAGDPVDITHNTDTDTTISGLPAGLSIA